MTESSSHNTARGSRGEQDFPVKDDLSELRSLLLGPEHAQLGKLQERLDDPKQYAQEVSRVLPEAISLRSAQDNKLTSSLTPPVEHILKTSVERDPRTLANALFPIIGPAIRKAIAETFRKMIQSLNHILERSFSWQGLKWRMEALRTGKSFAEVVLLHSLLYRVEQVFLIHRQTGLMLQHVLTDSTSSQDGDMVSGMLTAIQDFAHDSFKLQGEETLETLQIGELTVWVEQGPLAILAGVIRGNAPEDLRSTFTAALESIHYEQMEALEHFVGDTTPFEASRPHLEACLQARYKSTQSKSSPLLWLLAAALLIALGLAIFLPVRSHLRWKSYLEKLNAEKGIVVTGVDKRDGKYVVFGLLDPLATSPQTLLQDTMIDPQKVMYRWEPYQALHPELVLERAKRILNPPATVSVKLEDSTLVTEGAAPHRWILTARELVRAIPGIMHFQENGLVDTDLNELKSIKDLIENQTLNFASGSAEPAPGQRPVLESLVAEVRRLENLAQFIGMSFHIQIVGHTDDRGAEEVNRRLSQARADSIRAFLISSKINPTYLIAKGVGAREPLRHELTEHDSRLNRRVTFHVAFTEGEIGG